MAYKKLAFEQIPATDIAEQAGQVTEGIYLGKREVPFGTRDDGSPDIRVIVDMQGPNGEFSFWASTSIKMLLPQVATGTRLRITYRGLEKNPNTGRKFKAFDVEADEGIPV